MGCLPLPNTLTLFRARTAASMRSNPECVGNVSLALYLAKLTSHAQKVARYGSGLWHSWMRKGSRHACTAPPGVQIHTNGYCFTSNRRTTDQAPAVPSAPIARTRHHIVLVGSVDVESCDADTDCSSTSGVLKVSELSIWIV